MSHSLKLISSTQHCKFKPSDLFIALLLERSKLDHQLIVADILVSEILFDFSVSSFQLFTALSQVLAPSLVDVHQVVLSRLKLPLMPFLEIRKLLGVLSFELSAYIVTCLEDALHILLGSPFAVQKLALSPIKFVLKSFVSFFKRGIFSAQKRLILCEYVNFTAKSLSSLFNFLLQVGGLGKLVFKKLAPVLQ